MCLACLDLVKQDMGGGLMRLWGDVDGDGDGDFVLDVTYVGAWSDAALIL